MLKIVFKYIRYFYVHAHDFNRHQISLYNKYILLSILSHKISARIQDCIQEEGKESAPVYLLGISQNPIQLHVVAALEGVGGSLARKEVPQFSDNFCNGRGQFRGT